MTDAKRKSSKAADSESGPILVAVDFTEDSAAALLWACRYGACVNAPVIGMHVVHDPGEAPGYYRQADEEILRPLEDVAADMMNEFVKKLQGDHPDLAALKSLEKVLVKGIPATRILEIAKSNAARMIVMGSRGRTGLPHLLLGSKAERVVQLAPMPVTIVKAKNHGN